MKKRDKIDFSALKAPGSYTSSLDDFTDFLKTVDEAQKKAEELKEEVSKKNAPAEAETEKSAPEETLDELMAKLDSLTGLAEVKENVRSLINLVKVRKLREENGLPNTEMSLHLVFMGNPGTGKTTVARLIGGLYKAIGVLSKGQLVETDRAGLVAGYVGQTAEKTKKVIESAMGGVLFIDEAYALAPANAGNDFGREAIETILKAMEDHRDDLVVIAAGYENEMERFISSNPGLESRFNRYFIFEDYNGEELFEIFSSMCAKNSYVLDEEAKEFAAKLFTDLYENRDENFGNARDVRNIFENMVSVHSDRIAALQKVDKETLVTVLEEDVSKAAEM